MTQRQNSPQVGHFHHVYNRGNNRHNIFFERDNYLYFLRLIRQTFVVHDVDVVAYCLMPNHYHLLVYLRSDGLSQAMKSLSLSYTKAINKRFNRVGSLFQGRFQKILVTDTEYLVQLIRYRFATIEPLFCLFNVILLNQTIRFLAYPNFRIV
jgi:putative transposase